MPGAGWAEGTVTSLGSREERELRRPGRLRWQRLLPAANIRAADPVLLDEVLRLHARRRVHPKTSTVEVGGVPFVVDTSLRKRRVDVLYDASGLSSVLVYFDGRRRKARRAAVSAGRMSASRA
jgi:hypothetical protein